MPDTCDTVDTKRVYLCDSGGQYKTGTTDVTRTVHFGTPTDEERDCFTRVLKVSDALRSVIHVPERHHWLRIYTRTPVYHMLRLFVCIVIVRATVAYAALAEVRFLLHCISDLVQVVSSGSASYFGVHHFTM